MPVVQLAHPPQDREALWWTVWVLFGVAIPRTKVCPDHCSPFDAFADAYFGICTIGEGEPYEISRAIWHASRGLAGKSKTLSILGLTFGYLLGADITILGGSMAQSVNVHEYMTKGMESENLPADMTLDVTATRIQLTNKGRVRPLPASQKNVRGPHPSVLLMDEVDEMELPIYDAALGQPLPQPSYLGFDVETMTVVSSTWQNADGTLTEIFRRTEEQEPINEEGDPKTPIYRWCYKENHVDNNPFNPIINRSEGWLSEKTINNKRDEVSAEMFRIEYDLGEPSIGNRAIDTDLLDKCFTSEALPIWEEHSKDWDEWRFYDPVSSATYAAGADWAKEEDKTAITITRTDRGKREVVYAARFNRTSYIRMVGVFNREVMHYGVGLNGAWHDSTGLGNVINDLVDVRCRAFSMTGEKRVTLLSEYIVAIEKGLWVFPKVLRRHYYEHKHCRTGDLYSRKEEFHLPDTLCAGALAEHGAKRVVNSAAPLGVGSSGAVGALTRHFQYPSDASPSLVAPDAPIPGRHIDLGV